MPPPSAKDCSVSVQPAAVGDVAITLGLELVPGRGLAPAGGILDLST